MIADRKQLGTSFGLWGRLSSINMYNLVILGHTVFEIFEELISTNEHDEAYPNGAKRLSGRAFRLETTASFELSAVTNKMHWTTPHPLPHRFLPLDKVIASRAVIVIVSWFRLVTHIDRPHFKVNVGPDKFSNRQTMQIQWFVHNVVMVASCGFLGGWIVSSSKQLKALSWRHNAYQFNFSSIFHRLPGAPLSKYAAIQNRPKLKMCSIDILDNLQPVGWNLKGRLFDPQFGRLRGTWGSGWAYLMPAHGFLLSPFWHISPTVFELFTWLQKAFPPVRPGYDDKYRSSSYRSSNGKTIIWNLFHFYYYHYYFVYFKSFLS